MNIRLANIKDADTILLHDKHITRKELINSISLNRVYIAEENNEFCGWMRYNLFWDNTPFMNMLFLQENYRGKGYGKQMAEHWEKEMKLLGYSYVLTSTPSDERSQHFYAKLDYKAIGGFLLGNDPFEIIMAKKI